MLFQSGRDCEDIGIEDDVLGREPHRFGEQLVGARADLGATLEGIGLPFFIEGHHDRGGTVLPHEPRLAQEFCFPFLHADRVDDALALQALEPGFDDAPF